MERLLSSKIWSFQDETDLAVQFSSAPLGDLGKAQ
jgi:hypothetical protein